MKKKKKRKQNLDELVAEDDKDKTEDRENGLYSLVKFCQYFFTIFTQLN